MKRTTYEWAVNVVDKYGDISTSLFIDLKDIGELKEELSALLRPHFLDIIRHVEVNHEYDRTQATAKVVNGKLTFDDLFDDGTRIPKYIIKYLDRLAHNQNYRN